MSNIGCLGTNLPKSAAAELVASGVVHGPVTIGGVPLGDLEPVGKVDEPFFELVVVAKGKSPNELVVGFGEEILNGVDHNAADWHSEDDAAGEGIEGHLVVGVVLVEVIWPWG